MYIFFYYYNTTFNYIYAGEKNLNHVWWEV